MLFHVAFVDFLGFHRDKTRQLNTYTVAKTLDSWLWLFKNFMLEVVVSIIQDVWNSLWCKNSLYSLPKWTNQRWQKSYNKHFRFTPIHFEVIFFFATSHIIKKIISSCKLLLPQFPLMKNKRKNETHYRKTNCLWNQDSWLLILVNQTGYYNAHSYPDIVWYESTILCKIAIIHYTDTMHDYKIECFWVNPKHLENLDGSKFYKIILLPKYHLWNITVCSLHFWLKKNLCSEVNYVSFIHFLK